MKIEELPRMTLTCIRLMTSLKLRNLRGPHVIQNGKREFLAVLLPIEEYEKLRDAAWKYEELCK